MSATKNVRTVPQIIEVEVEDVVLTISPSQATALLDVLRAVGGHPRTTRRGLIEKIHDDLVAAGIKPSTARAGGYRPADMDGNIGFLAPDGTSLGDTEKDRLDHDVR